MDLISRVSQLLAEFAQQNDGWSLTSDAHSAVITFEETDSRHPALLSAVQNQDIVTVVAHTPNEERYIKLANDWLGKFGEEDATAEKGVFSTRISSGGFAVTCDVNDQSFDAYQTQLKEVLERQVQELTVLVQQSFKEMSEGKPASTGESAAPAVTQTDSSSAAVPPETVIKEYLDSKDYKYEHNTERKLFRFNFKMDNYVDHNDSHSLQIFIRYDDPGLVRIETPMMYLFDLKKVPYDVVASAIVWFQFRYKFLSMSLDPSDGECKISIDIPLMEGQLHGSQVGRIINFILQFVEDAHQQLFNTVLSGDVEQARKQVKSLLDDYNEEVLAKRWVNNLEDQIKGLTAEQREEIEAHIRSLSDKGDENSDKQGI